MGLILPSALISFSSTWSDESSKKSNCIGWNVKKFDEEDIYTGSIILDGATSVGYTDYSLSLPGACCKLIP